MAPMTSAAPLVLALDAGTTSTRVLAFDLAGGIVALARHAVPLSHPRPAWVEQDAETIRRLSLAALEEVLGEVGDRAVAIGIANQRETVVFWSRATGAALAPAIVWQDRRTADLCRGLASRGAEAQVQAVTGLLVDPYFSATKIRWALDHWPDVARAADRGDLAVGTVDSWLIACLSGGESHLTDQSNASRTALMDLDAGDWSPAMHRLFDIPQGLMGRIVPTSGALGLARIAGRTLPISGIAGDQQAATIGQGCLRPGMAKCTYGTGIFLLANGGAEPPRSRNRLIATHLASYPRQFALEGSIFVGGDAVKWLRDGLGILASAAETEAIARSVPDSGGVKFVPAFAGLGAPHWKPDARGLLAGLTSGTTRAHVVRATLEAMGQQTADLIDAFRADGVAPDLLRIDGGMAANSWLAQDIADSLGLPVERPETVETTALGAAMLAATGAGLFGSLADAADAMVRPRDAFEPRISADERAERRDRWQRAVAQALAGLGEVRA